MAFRCGYHLGNHGSGPDGESLRLIRESRPGLLLCMDNIAPSAIVEWARANTDGYLVLRKHFHWRRSENNGAFPSGASIQNWANGVVEMALNYSTHPEIRAIRDAGRLGLKLFNEPNMADGNEGFGADEASMHAYVAAFLEAQAMVRARVPGAKTIALSLTPGNRDAYFTTDVQNMHYWYHGPQAAKENPTAAEIEAARQSCILKPVFESCDWLGVHVYPPRYKWNTHYQGYRYTRFWQFVPERLKQNTFILECSCAADSDDQNARAEETRQWLPMVAGHGIRGMAYWWMRPGDGTWERHFVTEPSGQWRPVAHVIKEYNLATGQQPAPTPTPTPAPVPVPTPVGTRTISDDGVTLTITTPAVPAGSKYWRVRLVRILNPVESFGNANIYARVYRGTERLLNVPVQQSWPSGSAVGVTEAKPLNEFGDVSFPMSGSRDNPWIPTNGPGPYSVEVATGASERVSGMGLPVNQHFSFAIEYDEVTQGSTPVPTPTPPGATLRDVLIAESERRRVLLLNRNAALQRSIFADQFTPSSNEWEQTHGGIVYVCQRAEHLGTGKRRVYHAVKGRWDQIRYFEW